MIKKFLLSLALAAGFLTPVAVMTAPPAAADTCEPRSGEFGRRDIKQFDETFRVTTMIWHRDCVASGGGRYALVSEVNVIIYNVSGGNCKANEGLEIDQWKVNPDVLGNWNLGEKATPCPTGSTSKTLVWWAPDNLKIWQSAPSNERCVGGQLAADLAGFWSDSNHELPGSCV